MSDLKDHVEGELADYDRKMMREYKERRQKEILESAKKLVGEFQVRLEQSGVNKDTSFKGAIFAAEYALKGKIELLNALIERITDATADKALANTLDDVKELLAAVQTLAEE